MKQIIYDVIFRTWYNGGEKPKECEKVQSAIDSISNLFKAATRYIEEGGNMQTLKNVLGHNSLAMTVAPFQNKKCGMG
ncbi:hypothetical protein [Ruminococcus sp. 5_1_39BFAA]|uniref:hypothetical protein n=1 Tax=Ruminococcus sp. 5_1_39BFAA TaxID=457412 RepID=UPI003562EA1E